MIDATIGVVTWKRKDLIERCLRSIYATTALGRYRLIVVDNASNDGSVELIRSEFREVELIENPVNLGIAKPRNEILRRATGRYTIILDNDTEVLGDALDALVRTMDAHPRAAIGGPKLLNPDGTYQLSCRTFQTLGTVVFRATALGRWFPDSRWVAGHLMTDWAHDRLRSVDWVLGAGLIMRNGVVQTLGLFDEGYFYLYEEVDWCYRARRQGWEVLYVPEAQIIHLYQRTGARSFNRMTLFHIRSALRFLAKKNLLRLGLARA